MKETPLAATPLPGAAEEFAPHITIPEAREAHTPQRKPRPLKPINGTTLRSKRIQHGIPGHIVCKRLGWVRSKLTVVERGYRDIPGEELARVDAALDQLIQTKAALLKTAASLGWPSPEVV